MSSITGFFIAVGAGVVIGAVLGLLLEAVSDPPTWLACAIAGVVVGLVVNAATPKAGRR